MSGMAGPVTMAHELGDYTWLVGDDAAVWLDRISADPRSLVAKAGHLRKFLSPSRVRLVLEQVELRCRARVKFPDADRMFFTRTGLEQATDAVVAQYKARRFPAGEPVADLCCGIGGDLLALAQRGAVTGVDRDPITALLAAANLQGTTQPLGRIANPSADSSSTEGGTSLSEAKGVVCQRATPFVPQNVPPRPTVERIPSPSHDASTVRAIDVAEFPLDATVAWHLDPDRRPGGRRTTRIEFHQPGRETMDRLLQVNGNAGIKLAPAAEVPASWAEAAEVEWIGHDRQCRQLVVWFGRLAQHPGRRRATVLHDVAHADGPRVRTIVGNSLEPIPVAERLGRYIFEPDATVLAAGLAGVLAAQHGLAAVFAGVAYLVGEHPIVDPAIACFEVLDAMPWDLKRVRQWCRQRNVGRIEIKKRAVRDDPEQVRRRLDLRGDEAAVLLLTPTNARVMAILGRRWTGAVDDLA